MGSIFVEAETFESLGGWVVDTQCVEAMGSPYLMAHGLGKPVPDAVTRFHAPVSAEWHLYARTRDWTAVWGRGRPAGRFSLLVDSLPLADELGTNGSEWHWQAAGKVQLEAGQHTLALHDLTGFNGRCDAVYLTTDPTDLPPDGGEGLARLRLDAAGTLAEADPCDLLICGGGYAGTCMALAAKSLGLKVALIQDRSVLGGCGSSEIRVWTGGMTNLQPYPQLGNISGTLSPIVGWSGMCKQPEYFEDARKINSFTPGEDLFLNEMVTELERDPANPARIAAAITQNVRSGQRTRRHAAYVADCTGDAFVARQAGCATMYGREASAQYGEQLAPEKADRLVMGHSCLWNVREADTEAVFPDVDWGVEFTEDNALFRTNCCWDWETGQLRDQVLDIEYIRDYGLMTCIANWSFLKNRSSRKNEWRKLELEWISPIGGKRESYRVIGDVVLSESDIEQAVPYDDATAMITWNIDLHYPDPENQGLFAESFQSCAYHRDIGAPYPVPYRCLYARDADNLFLGGRIVSATHVAFGCIRVMRTLGMLGEVVAMAAKICKDQACLPRSVYTEHLEALKAHMSRGVPRPQQHGGYPASRHERYHFMRPAGRFGNPTESIWIDFPETGDPPEQDVPAALRDCIRELAQTHIDGHKPFHP